MRLIFLRLPKKTNNNEDLSIELHFSSWVKPLRVFSEIDESGNCDLSSLPAVEEHERVQITVGEEFTCLIDGQEAEETTRPKYLQLLPVQIAEKGLEESDLMILDYVEESLNAAKADWSQIGCRIDSLTIFLEQLFTQLSEDCGVLIVEKRGIRLSKALEYQLIPSSSGGLEVFYHRDFEVSSNQLSLYWMQCSSLTAREYP